MRVTSIFFLPLMALGWVLDLLEIGMSVKALLLVGVVTCFAYDVATSARRNVGTMGAKATLLLFLAGILAFLNLFALIKQKYSVALAPFANGSIFHIVGLGIMPLLCLLAVAVGVRPARSSEVSCGVHGVFLMLAFSCLLGVSGFAPSSTERAYSDLTRSMGELRDYRVVLPGFSGAVSGGIMAALLGGGAIGLWIAGWKRKWSAYYLTGSLVVAATAVVLTETRSTLVSIIVAACMLGGYLYRSICRIPWVFAVAMPLLPAVFPFVYPAIGGMLTDIIPQRLSNLFARSSEFSPWEMSGRTEIWNSSAAMAARVENIWVGDGPFFELINGLPAQLEELGVIGAGGIGASHAHNAYLNLYMNDGLLGVAAAFGVMTLAFGMCLERGKEGGARLRSVLGVLLTLNLSCCLESVFNFTYFYFIPLLVLLVCEIVVAIDPWMSPAAKDVVGRRERGPAARVGASPAPYEAIVR